MTVNVETRHTRQSLPRLEIPEGRHKTEPEEITTRRVDAFLDYCRKNSEGRCTHLPSAAIVLPAPEMDSVADSNEVKDDKADKRPASPDTLEEGMQTLAFTDREWEVLESLKAEHEHAKAQHEDWLLELHADPNRHALSQCKYWRKIREQLNAEMELINERRNIRKKFRQSANNPEGVENWIVQARTWNSFIAILPYDPTGFRTRNQAMSSNGWPQPRKGVNPNTTGGSRQHQAYTQNTQHLTSSSNNPALIAHRQEMIRQQQVTERKLTAATVRWPFLNNESNPAASGNSLHRSNAIRRRNTGDTVNQGMPTTVDNDTFILRRSKSVAIPMEHMLTYDGLGVPPPTIVPRRTGKLPNPIPLCVDNYSQPWSPLDELACDPLRTLARRRASESEGFANNERASRLPDDDIENVHHHCNAATNIPLGPPPPRPPTARDYRPRPLHEPAPQNVVNDLRNQWQGVQRPIKVHKLPTERLSRR
ncbi:hypothetical protein F4776DRAFT_673891 [Hypoxylon sp. NC0597]|nr:hypothetical protein F4776DRAFT_673891 [Hypoxylon sp. NC0597]